MHRAVLALAALAVLPLAACVFVPLPPIGAQVGREEIEKLQPGASTRSEAHDRLGKPSRSVTERYEIFDLSREEGYLVGAIFPLFLMGGERVGEQDFRILVEYRPDGVVERLHWEGMVEDHHALEGYRYVSSGSQSTSRRAAAISSIGRRPILTWHDRLPSTDRLDAAAVAAPQGTKVAIVYQGRSFTRTILHDALTGEVLADHGAPAGCPQLVIPAGLAPAVFLSDGQHMVSMAEDAILCVWNVQTGDGRLTFEKHWKPRSAFGLAAGNRLISLVSARSAPIVATADMEGIIRVWNGLSGVELTIVEPCSSDPGCGSWFAPSIGRLVLSDDGHILGTFQSGEREDAVRLWDTSTGTELASFAMPDRIRSRFAYLTNLALSPDGRRLALHMGDHVEIWRIQRKLCLANGASSPQMSFELERVFILPPIYIDAPTSGPPETHRYVRSLAFSADGRRLAAGDGTTIVWETDDWREVWRAELGSRQLWPALLGRNVRFALMPDGRRIVTACCAWQLPEPIDAVSAGPSS